LEGGAGRRRTHLQPYDAAARASVPLPLFTFDELTEPPFRRFRWGVRSSGTYLPETIADALEDLWESRVAAHVRASAAVSEVGGGQVW
jgi:hypothetical protein